MKTEKKGFTLVELLAVIAVIAALAMIVTPTVLNSLKQSREKSYVEQTHLLEETAERWSIKHANDLSETEKNYLEINTLISEGYLQSDEVLDPRDESKMNGCIVIAYDKENDQFDFTYNENTCTTLKGQE